MGVQKTCTVLSDITNGRAAALKRSMTCEEADYDIPVVDPAEIHCPGEKPRIPFTQSQMLSLGEMRGTNDRWRQLVQSLGEREGTIYDVSGDIIGYEDQASLTEARVQATVDVEATMVFAALRGTASWPDTIRVECFLRDSIMVESTCRSRVAALKLWGIVVATISGPEVIRRVVEMANDWAKFKPEEAQCSDRGTDMVAHVAWRRATAYQDYLWTNVMLAVDVASADVFWDWRRVSKSCFAHSALECGEKKSGPIRAYFWVNKLETEHGWHDTIGESLIWGDMEDDIRNRRIPPADESEEEDDESEDEDMATGKLIDFVAS